MSGAPDRPDDAPFDPWHLDRRAVRAAFDAAAATYDACAALQDEVRARLLERLDLTRLAPRRILDLGCGTGAALPALAARFPDAELCAVDLAPARARAAAARAPSARVLVADGAALPFADESFELAFCNLVLQWEDDPRPTLAELRRVLAPRGLLLLTSFGPDTLAELRDAWEAGDRAAGGSAVHVNRFLDLHDLGDALVQARFVEPVLDVEHLTTTYGSMRELMRELKGLGAHNVNAGRARGLTGRRRFAAAEAAYPRDADGRAPATWEVVYGTAWTPLDRGEGAHSRGPLGAIPLDALRAELRKRR